MKISRIYADANGESHFDELDIPLIDSGKIGMLSHLEKTTGIIFRETATNYDYPWHPTPHRQYVIILNSKVDFTVSDGETRRFGAGDVVLLEDTFGKGHYSRAVNGEARKSVFVRLD